MKASELAGFRLDWAVAKAEGEEAELHHGEVVTWKTIGYHEYRLVWRPSTDWAQGGSIIEREKINIEFDPDVPQWFASYDRGEVIWGCSGLTPLIAAMRCYVASKLDDEVELPEEIKQ